MCSLVSGFLLAFTVVIMPGIGSLDDKEFIRAFQVIDRVIQNRQPIFMLLWIGSVIFLMISAGLSIAKLNQTGLIFMIMATLFYLIGVQLPTGTINIPLNNNLQRLDINTINKNEQKAARKNFESRWVRWNLIRTVFSIFTSLLLIILLYWQ